MRYSAYLLFSIPLSLPNFFKNSLNSNLSILEFEFFNYTFKKSATFLSISSLSCSSLSLQIIYACFLISEPSCFLPTRILRVLVILLRIPSVSLFPNFQCFLPWAFVTSVLTRAVIALAYLFFMVSFILSSTLLTKLSISFALNLVLD